MYASELREAAMRLKRAGVGGGARIEDVKAVTNYILETIFVDIVPDYPLHETTGPTGLPMKASQIVELAESIKAITPSLSLIVRLADVVLMLFKKDDDDPVTPCRLLKDGWERNPTRSWLWSFPGVQGVELAEFASGDGFRLEQGSFRRIKSMGHLRALVREFSR